MPYLLRLTFAASLVACTAWLAFLEPSRPADPCALQFAASRGNVSEVRSAIDAGADVNALAPAFGTPLMRAAAFDQIDMMKLLIARGADVNLRNEFGHTALWHAAVSDHPRAAAFLIAHGATVDASCLKDAGGDHVLALLRRNR